MIHVPNEKLRQISRLLTATEWAKLKNDTLMHPELFNLAVFREPKFERVANVLLREVNTTNVWESYNNMTKALSLCEVYAKQISARESATMRYSWDTVLKAQASFKTPTEAGLEALWLLSYRWNGLPLSAFDSEDEKAWLLAQVEVVKQDPHAKAKLLWEAHDRDCHDVHRAWKVQFGNGAVHSLNSKPEWAEDRTYTFDPVALKNLPLKRRGVVERAQIVEIGSCSVREAVTDYLCQGYFDLKLAFQTREAAEAAKDAVVKALRER